MLTVTLGIGCGFLIAASIVAAQRPGGNRPAAQRSADADDLVARMMEFDKDRDGKLTKAEVTDTRLHRLFERADTDNNATVTKAELAALAAREQSKVHTGRPGFGGPGGGPGGFMMGMPRPGEILTPLIQQRLRLTAAQKSQIEDLQKEVDAKLNAILTDEQKKQLNELRQRGPGGFGPPGGFGRPRRLGPPVNGLPGAARPPGEGPLPPE
jgi:hypothetical protein